MKRSSFLFLSFLAFLLAQGFTGQAQAPGIEKLYTLDKDANISYNISNDNQSLIVAIKVTDAAQQMKLARNGLEIWIDPKGKKNKKTGVHYPLAETSGDHPNRGQMPQDFGISDTGVVFLRKQAARTLASKKEAEMVGFKATFNGKKSSDDTTGISIATDFTDKQTLYYSVHIPFEAFTQPLDFSHPLSVGIIIKGMTFPGGGPDGPGGGGPGGGEGGFGGGGGEMGPPPGGGPGGPDGDDMQKLFADDIVWQKVNIKH